MKTGIELIAAERERQITAEGWSEDHDATHIEGQLAYAAASYALYHGLKTTFPPESFVKLRLEDQATKEWPWDAEWWKPSSDSVQNLVKAGALIAAEIDRISRMNVKAHAPLPAGAHVDHGVDAETTEAPNNKAAGRGCHGASCSASLILRDGGIDATSGVKVMWLKYALDKLHRLLQVVHRRWMLLREKAAVKTQSNHQQATCGRRLRPEAHQIDGVIVNGVNTEGLGGINEDWLPKGIREYLANGGVMPREMEIALASLENEVLREGLASNGISESLRLCPGDHGSGKSETVACIMRSLGISLQNAELSRGDSAPDA